MQNENRSKRASLKVFDDFSNFSIDEKELDKIIDKLNDIGNINVIPLKELEIYLSNIKEKNNAE